jgi:diguanylate cyclase (GGDEF)-like protein
MTPEAGPEQPPGHVRRFGPAGRPALTVGVSDVPARVLAFQAVVLVAALTAALIGILRPATLPADAALSPSARLGLVAAVVALAQLARLRFRMSSGGVDVTWGEAALIIGFYLAPAGWLPAATFVGAGVAWLLLSMVTDNRTPVEVLHAAASVTVAAAVATGVTTLFANPFQAPLTPFLAFVLTLGALTHLLVMAGLTAVTQALRHRVPIGRPLRRALHGRPLMFVGNVVVGLVAIVMLDRDPRWLLLLPPALWLLHQTYGHRLRVDDERRAWEAFAQATGALNQLDEPGVATAGVRGALELFRAERVEVDVIRADGTRHRYTGDESGTVVGADVTGDAARAASSRVAVRALSIGELHVGELRVRFPYPVVPTSREQMAMSAFSDALGGALHDAATHHQLSELTARSSHEAVHDTLTGLANRAGLLAEGGAALRLLDPEQAVALLLLDLNHFKEVNETLGHGAGDQLLKVTAGKLVALVRPGELAARLGDDEFALLVPHLPVLTDSQALRDGSSPVPQALRRAREITEQVAAPTEVAGVQLVVEASVGVVVATAGTADMAELVRRADIAMFQAKDGGNSIAVYDDTRDAASTDQLALLAELREALDADDQLVLALQPAVDLRTGAPTGVEALIRWQHPRRGWLTPVDFVRAVEDSEQLWPFTRYVIDHALAAVADWTAQGIDVPVSVNLSARSLLDTRLPAEIDELLRRHRVPPHRLVLEITETVVMSELEIIDEVLAGLRKLGVQLSVDDFGTGYSSLAFLTRITVDELKIDRSFVGKMADSTEAAAIVRTTVDLGRGLGLRVVAEGVETADQRAALAELGCTAAQGYHFCTPTPTDKIVAALRSLGGSSQATLRPLRADDAS